MWIWRGISREKKIDDAGSIEKAVALAGSGR